MFGQPAALAAPANPNNDYAVPSSPTDGVSQLCFTPSNQFLVASSWASTLSCWETRVQEGLGGGQVAAQPRAQVQLAAPALCCAASADSQTVFGGMGDGTVQMWRLGQQTAQAVGKHDAPVKSIFHVPEINCVVTGSWDKTIRAWDLRQPNPAATIRLPERCYAMDCRHPLVVVGTAERKICIYDLTSANWQNPYRVEDSPLRHQTRSIAAFPDRGGFAIGSVEGRVAIHHVDPKDAHRNFAFKCHRESTDGRAGQPGACDIYAVNAICFHHLGTFATAGSDGVFNFWDKDSKQRLMAFKKADRPISCSAFNPAGNLYAYALSYDWSRGSESHSPNAPNTIMLHKVQKDEITQRNKKPGRK
mmetsp:Transcript_1092/g.3315  ORF Transcript_1092/g.3315 Transcript_1092/m.3315 type:complete len:361 (+) Transcript_1092:230-1312(+)